MDNLAKWCGITNPELLKVSWLKFACIFTFLTVAALLG